MIYIYIFIYIYIYRERERITINAGPIANAISPEGAIADTAKPNADDVEPTNHEYIV